MKRFLIRAAIDIVWVLAVIFCARVFAVSIASFVMSIGLLLIAKWATDAVLTKVLPAKQPRVTGSYSTELPTPGSTRSQS